MAGRPGRHADISGDRRGDAEPPVEEVSLKITFDRERLRVLSYRVMLDVPRELILFVSGLLAERRREIGTRKGTRKLGCYRQALFALAWFRDKGDIPRLGAGSGLAQSTAYRYLDEVIDVLAACAPGLREALERALAEGTPYVILDGKIVDTDRCREKTLSRKGLVIDLWFAGKTRDFGGNIQAVFYPGGRCGFLTCSRAMSMTWPRPGRMSWQCCGRSWTLCPRWLIPDTKAQVTASTSR